MTFQFRHKNDSSFHSRGFFGIAILNPKHETNVGVLLRSASIFNAAFMATVGEKRYKSMNSDTMKSWKHVPLFHFSNLEDLKNHLPKHCPLIGVELTNESTELQLFEHPERALYLFGAEDYGIPYEMLKSLDYVIKIGTPRNVSLNVSVAGSIVLYDRLLKLETK